MSAVYSSPPAYLVQRLPPVLFALVTQFLPLHEKLLQLTHVSRSFPSLTPTCFACDTLVWTPTLLERLHSCPSSPLHFLLSQVSSAVFVDPISDSLCALTSLLNPPAAAAAACSFPALRSVTIAPDWRRPAEPLTPPQSILLQGLQHCHQLTALDLYLWYASDVEQASCISSLPLLRSLRSLRLRSLLSTEQFLVVLSLPLTHLDLSESRVEVHTSPPNPFPPLPPYHTLLLPWLCDDRPFPGQAIRPRVITLWEHALLSFITRQGDDSGVRLERLLLAQMEDLQDLTTLLHIPLLRHLHTLQLHFDVANDGDMLQVVLDFYAALATSDMPMRHLDLSHDTMHAHPPPATLLTQLVPVISAFSGLLHSFKLNFSDSEDARAVLSTATMWAMTAALLSCRSLRSLDVEDFWLTPTAMYPFAEAFPYLRLLSLRVADAIHFEALASG